MASARISCSDSALKFFMQPPGLHQPTDGVDVFLCGPLCPLWRKRFYITTEDTQRTEGPLRSYYSVASFSVTFREALMKKFSVILVLLSASAVAQTATKEDIARWEREAQNITIIRDDWGIAHVYGKTDADAVFGAEYAQAEDDFNRVETNYINAMGRLAETEGEARIWQDLRMKLFIDPVELKKEYAASPAALRALMDAFAD